ncbi:ABC transporter permease [Roseospirillum parvum]|uniref:Transport permease protein n=1 Tax=Roseospirillum parvum TaxID=83401 RepID=A0A1G7ZBT3_9PROT|nr:ABC transporter permease [Roseospirillum parvum]SDH06089.1 ABC-2 type transport system permease protein [Roseospirillum parvum]
MNERFPLPVRRVLAIVLRHIYVLRGSPPRILEMAYWPTVQMILWGFISKFFVGHSEWVAQAAGVLIAGVLLWDVLFRANIGQAVGFMEEMWSRNLGHLFVSPLRPYEFLVGTMTMSLVRTTVGVLPAALLAIPFYDFNVFGLGWPLATFFASLMMFGWAIGVFISGILLRFGLGAESLAWAFVFAFGPISGIYYPISVLPEWLQAIALAAPPAHVFEGMRAVLFEGRVDTHHMAAAFGLNLLYLGAAAAFFLAMVTSARRRGQLLDLGE